MATHKPINILEAFAAPPPPLDYVLPNMVAGTVGALVSPGGAGKSMLALQLAAQIAGGRICWRSRAAYRPGDLLARRRPANRHTITACTRWGRTSATSSATPWPLAC